MAIAANKTFRKISTDSFPVTESIVLPLSIFVDIQNNEFSPNSVSVLLVDTSDTVTIAPGQEKTFNATSNALEGELQITFFGPATVDVNYTDGDQAAPPPSAGDATAANQVILQNYLNGTTPSTLSGQEDTPTLFEETTVGAKTTDLALAFSIKFEGTGGTLDGVTVKNGYIAEYSTNGRNQVKSIPYTVPTVADFEGFKRVLITYVKI